MNCPQNGNCKLTNRVKELEEQIKQLRVSRRVLLTLLEKIQKEKSDLLNKLVKHKDKKKSFKIIKANFNK